MRQINFEIEFKKDLSNIEIAGMDSIINIVASNSDYDFYGNNEGTYYTSSSAYAMLSVDGLEYYDNEEEIVLEVNHLAIAENDMLVMVCIDENEKYYYYEIEPKDFY